MKFKNVAKFLLCFLVMITLLACGSNETENTAKDTGTKKNTKKRKKKGKAKPAELQKPKTLTKEQQKEFLKSVAGKRLGLIDVGIQRDTPPQILDLATSFLSEKRDIQLVERSDLNEILKEQALQFSMHTENDPQKVVQLGKLIKADALLMFETGEDSGAYTPLRLRLVGTQMGNKIWDDTLLIKKNFDSLEADVNVIIDRAISKLQFLDAEGDRPFVIGISEIRGTGFNGQLEWLGNEIAAGIERQLSNRAGVLLVERHTTRPLVDEAHLDANPATNLKAATVLVRGTYRLDREAGENALILSLHYRTHEQEEASIELSGQTTDIAQLCGNASDALLEKLALPLDGHPPMHPEKEALFLVKQAQIFQAIQRPDKAIPPLQAAMALAPRLLKPKLLFLRSVQRVKSMRSFIFWRKDVSMEKRRQYFKYYFPLCMQGLETARKMLESPDFPKTHDWRSRKFDSDLSRQRFIWQLNYSDGVFGYPSTLLKICNCPETREAVNIMAPAYRSLFPIYLKVTDKKIRYYSFLDNCLADGTRAGRYWFSTPEQVLDHLWTLVEKAEETGNFLPLDFVCIRSPLWPSDQELHRLYLGFLARLSKHESPVVRALAQRCYAIYYYRRGPHRNLAKNLVHFESFVRLLEKEVLPRFLNSEYNIGLWARINESSIPHYLLDPRPELSEKLKGYDIPAIARLKRRSMEAFLLPGSKHIGWRLLMSDAAIWSEHAGEAREMIQLLKRCKKHLNAVEQGPNSALRYYKPEIRGEIDKIIRQLLRRHPELREAGDMTATVSFASKVVLEAGSIQEAPGADSKLPGKLNMVGMIKTANHLAVICVDSGYSSWGNQHIGILRLDPVNMEPLDYRGLSGLDYSTSRRANYFTINSDHGPRRCTWKDEVLLGLYESGIVRFPEGGEPVYWNESTGLVSQDIISSMDVLNGKLYAIVREGSFDESLMEVDLDSGKSRILISAQGSDDQGDLQRVSLRSIVTEPGQPYLLINVVTGNGESSKLQWGLYRYDPENRKAKWHRTIWPGSYCRMFRRDSQVLFVDRAKVGLLPAVGRSIKWYYLMKQAVLHLPRGKPGLFKFLYKPSVKWRDDGEVMKCVLMEDRLLLLTCEDQGRIPTRREGPYRLLLFKKGKRKPVEVKGEGIPAAETVVDMMRLDDRALLLTHDTLYSLSLK